MPPENLRFGGGASETLLHPIVLAAMLIAIVLIFLLPRKYVIWPVLVTAFLIPIGQTVLVGGLHFFVIRIIILAVSARIFASMFTSPEGAFGNRWSTLDTIFVFWALFRALAGVLVFSLNSSAIVYQGGFLLDALGGYFVLRYLIRDDDDIYKAIRVFAVISVIIAGCMLFEKFHQVNVFGLLGGVRAAPEVRLGSVRAEGPFQHELLAGTFGATLLPLFFLLWKRGTSQILAVLGAISSTVMVVTSHSSTSVLAYGAALIAICAWPLRRHMRPVRWAVVLVLVALHLAMKAPVWFLIARVDIVGGSSGYHRAMLVNDFITHFRDWWLIGTADNAQWGYTMWDLCNQFVSEGELGGLATFACFVAMVVLGFSRIGTARKNVEGDREKEWYFWLLGATLLSHVTAFFGVSYFDQTRVLWFATLAFIVTATAPYLAVKKVLKEAPRPGYRHLKPAYSAPLTSRPKPFFALKQQSHFKP
ncbi:MAG TPA: hypothetical protein VIH67_07840 [Candidatus Acidoferrum sp.]|jgi:hypothetical protein